MKKRKMIATATAAVAMAATPVAAAHAATNKSYTSSKPSYSQLQSMQMPGDNTVVTDATVLADVTSAVQAKYSDAIIDKVLKLPDGTYLALTKQSDTMVIVEVDASYNVTGTESPGNGRGPSNHKQQGVIGTVTAISSTSITIENKQTSSSTIYTLDSSTKITKDRTSVTYSSIALGDTVQVVVSTSDSSVAASVNENTNMPQGQPPKGGHQPSTN